MRSIFSILSVVAALLLFWYAAAFSLNSNWAYNKAERAGVTLSFSELVSDTWSQENLDSCTSSGWVGNLENDS